MKPEMLTGRNRFPVTPTIGCRFDSSLLKLTLSLKKMSANRVSNPVRRADKWHKLLVLSLFSGAMFQQTVMVRAQGNTAKPAPDVIVFTNGDQLTGNSRAGHR